MKKLLVMLALLGIVTVNCNAEEWTYICPSEIVVAWKVSSLPAGWQTLTTDAGIPVRHPLASATFTDGHPHELAFLRPTAEDATVTTKGSIRTSVYEFSGVSPDGIWLVCQYHNTPAIIFRKLPASVQRCEVTQSEDEGVQSIRCR